MNTNNAPVVASPEQEFALALQFLGKLHAGRFPADAVQAAKENSKHPIWLALETLRSKSIDAILKEWQKFYKKYFGLTIDFSELKLPENKSGFDRLIIVVAGLTLNRVYDACAMKFPCWCFTEDLDVAVPKNDRDPMNGTYSILVRDVVEADEELKDLSANMLTEKGIKGITLLERMLFELKYFSKSMKHLDIKNRTLCSGSRDSGVGVPGANWGGRWFEVDCYLPGNRFPNLRSREAVSL